MPMQTVLLIFQFLGIPLTVYLCFMSKKSFICNDFWQKANICQRIVNRDQRYLKQICFPSIAICLDADKWSFMLIALGVNQFKYSSALNVKQRNGRQEIWDSSIQLKTKGSRNTSDVIARATACIWVTRVSGWCIAKRRIDCTPWHLVSL